MQLSLELLILCFVVFPCQTVISFRPLNNGPLDKHQRTPKYHNHRGLSLGTKSPVNKVESSALILRLGKNDEDEAGLLDQAYAIVGLAAQPVVWVSLYYVQRTGAGLPAGPFGILGALEGISYLIILSIAVISIYTKLTIGSAIKSAKYGLVDAAERLSYLSLLAGLTILASLVVDLGCVPNAKPILDYSAYLPICESTPGIFGGN